MDEQIRLHVECRVKQTATRKAGPPLSAVAIVIVVTLLKEDTNTTQLARAQGIMDLPPGPLEPEQHPRVRRRGQHPLL